jgi:uncharacterized protein with von Willebrand factor type A (vWA) domain
MFRLKDREKWIPEKIKPRMPIEDRSREKTKSWMELLRVYERERLAKDGKEEGMSSFQETMALHEELAEDVRKAKSKIRKAAARKLTEEDPERMLVPVVVFPRY